MKNGMAKKAADDDAEMTVDDYVATPADNYKFMAGSSTPSRRLPQPLRPQRPRSAAAASGG